MFGKNIFLTILLLCFVKFQAQISALTEKYNLDATLNESSGLLYINNRLISMNDSGNAPRLYEMDTISNQIIRTIDISYANNVDWEALAEDDDYIYIGDFGNNLGNRTDLMIYRINKTDYLAGNQVPAAHIRFSYDDQTDFTLDSNTNFDAEAMIVNDTNIFIFTKNHGDQHCSLYKIPKFLGTFRATLVSTYDTQGMITDANYDRQNEQIFLTGYDNRLNPFIIRLAGYAGIDFFSGSVDRISVSNQAVQIEGITRASSTRYFMTSETFNYGSTNIPGKLFAFNSLFSTGIDENNSGDFKIYPNPADGDFFVGFPELTTGEIIIINTLGQIVWRQYFSNEKILQFNLPKNIYFVKIITGNRVFKTKLIVK